MTRAMPQLSIGDRYVLATGEAAMNRLALLHSIYGPPAERLMMDIGIPLGTKIADIGCGTGMVSSWFAKQVGDKGEVTALDVSADQLTIARRTASENKVHNLSFIKASAYETGLPRDHFDIVHCRLLLCHLLRPLDALCEMVAILKPGGLLICFDIDLANLFSVPHTECYQRISDLCLAIGQHRGVDHTLGLKLPNLFQQVNLPKPDIAFIQPVYMRDEKKRLWEYSFLEASPAIIEAGLCTAGEVSRLREELAAIAYDETIFVVQARMPVVWARKPH